MQSNIKKNGLSVVEVEYLRLLNPELQQAIKQGEPERAASFAKEIARLRRKALMSNGSEKLCDLGER